MAFESLEGFVPWRRGRGGSTEKKDRAFSSFRHEMNDLVERFFGGEGSPSFPGGGWRQFIPRVDVTETDAEVCVRAELPGVAKEDLAVNISDSHMIIRGEKKTERKEEEPADAS
jgi:HSP20 family protein